MAQGRVSVKHGWRKGAYGNVQTPLDTTHNKTRSLNNNSSKLALLNYTPGNPVSAVSCSLFEVIQVVTKRLQKPLRGTLTASNACNLALLAVLIVPLDYSTCGLQKQVFEETCSKNTD